MTTNSKGNNSHISERVNSIDFFRGLIMFLLAGASTGIFSYLLKSDIGLVHSIGIQFTHQPWEGLHFWDLIQPYFMFIVGLSIPFAIANRLRKGQSKAQINRHAIKRSFLLLFFGWALHCLYAGKIVWQFQNVLAQIGLTYLIAFFILDKSFTFQIIFTLITLLIIDLAYRFFPVAGFDNPWVIYENLGSWTNNIIEGVEKTSQGETAIINFISNSALTIWGMLCGRLLMSGKTVQAKSRILIIAGTAALFIGYTLELAGITPIIKQIGTSSFVFVSGGYTILTLALFYWLIDVKKLFATDYNFIKVMGMNPIFIYLFFQAGGSGFLARLFVPFTNVLFSWTGELGPSIINSALVWASLWYICYFLYKRKVFIKI